MELVLAAIEEPPVEVHEVTHLVNGATPVLGGKGEHREGLHADGERAVGGVDQGVLARAVTLGAREPPALGPTAVSVHHDRHVTGNTGRARATRESA